MHVFSDIEPYVCTSGSCEDSRTSFPTRASWAEHEFSHHRSREVWRCFECSLDFDSGELLGAHVDTAHSEKAPTSKSERKGLLQAAKVSVVNLSEQDCPMCSKNGFDDQREWATHVGKHMEEIALALLPRMNASDEEEDEESSIGSNVPSLSQRDSKLPVSHEILGHRVTDSTSQLTTTNIVEVADVVHIAHDTLPHFTLTFPANAIEKGKVLVDQVRSQVAEKLRHAPWHIVLFLADTELSIDEMPIQLYGCDHDSKISVLIDETRTYSSDLSLSKDRAETSADDFELEAEQFRQYREYSRRQRTYILGEIHSSSSWNSSIREVSAGRRLIRVVALINKLRLFYPEHKFEILRDAALRLEKEILRKSLTQEQYERNCRVGIDPFQHPYESSPADESGSEDWRSLLNISAGTGVQLATGNPTEEEATLSMIESLRGRFDREVAPEALKFLNSPILDRDLGNQQCEELISNLATSVLQPVNSIWNSNLSDKCHEVTSQLRHRAEFLRMLLDHHQIQYMDEDLRHDDFAFKAKIESFCDKNVPPSLEANVFAIPETLEAQPLVRRASLEFNESESGEMTSLTQMVNDGIDDTDELTISPSSIDINSSPTLNNFRIGIQKKFPTIPLYLAERLAYCHLCSLERLIKYDSDHARLLATGQCPSGILCVHLGRKSRMPPPHISVTDTSITHAQSQMSSGLDIDIETSVSRGCIVSRSKFPPGVPLPPTARLPAEFECPFCFRMKVFYNPSDWTKHIYEDIQPATCTSEDCPDPKIFKRKADWDRHENEHHRHSEYWRCNFGGCAYVCYHKESFIRHIVSEHKVTRPRIKVLSVEWNSANEEEQKQFREFWQLIENCYQDTSTTARQEPCKFCGKVYGSWKKLSAHMFRHMEQIALPMIELSKMGIVGKWALNTSRNLPLGSTQAQSLNIDQHEEQRIAASPKSRVK